MDQRAAVKHHAQKSLAAGDPVRDAAGDHGRLSGIEVERAPFGVVERVAAELEPDLVLVAAAVKPPLLLLQVVAVDPELLAGVKDRRLGSAFPGHAGEIIEA